MLLGSSSMELFEAGTQLIGNLPKFGETRACDADHAPSSAVDRVKRSHAHVTRSM
jgi:hypothetical protein